MPALIIDGKALAKKVREGLKVEAGKLSLLSGRKPGLAVVLVGDNPASKLYVASKSKAAKACGIETKDLTLSKEVSDFVLQNTLEELNADDVIDGILLQLPLPKHLDEFKALLCIDPNKDVDGLHPLNQGLLLRGEKAPRACTPSGILKLIDNAREQLRQSTDLSGLHAVVIGRSILVGKPVALMLLERNCTVSFCHSRTENLAGQCRQADIVVAAIGKPRLVTQDFVKPGAIVIDVGISRVESGTMVGDVDFESVKEIAGAVTPVPGGVGPMTIAMLLANTVELAWKKVKKR